MGSAQVSEEFSGLALYQELAARPLAMLDAMIAKGINAPLASSCGRLFDAVAAALGICVERQAYEGEAAARLEAIVDERTLRDEDEARAYPFALETHDSDGLAILEPRPMWVALLADLADEASAPIVAARFHKGLAAAIVAMARKLAEQSRPRFDTVALSGGCFQNRMLFEEVQRRLEADGFEVLTHSRVPANDGGLALGQAAIAAATLVGEKNNQTEGDAACASAFPA
jgi:hydrogenase maturation protein HypF